MISLSLSDLQRWQVIVLQELADDLPLVMADRVQVQQVIMNLVRNASDAMSNVDDRPRELLIRTEREEGDRVQLSVKDAGVGFEPQAATDSSKPSIRRRMTAWASAYRSVVPSSRLMRGVCGRQRMMVREPHFHFQYPAKRPVWWQRKLAAAGRMVRRMPHDVSSTLNTDSNVHTLVRLTAYLAGAHSSLMESNRDRESIERPLVTVVDDDVSVRESLPNLLRQFGFSARAFSSAEEFLGSDCVSQTRCLILDVVMPGITGLDLQRQLKLRGPALPIIFITGQKDEGIRKRALEQGAVGFLLKPVISTVLLEAVNVALRGN